MSMWSFWKAPARSVLAVAGFLVSVARGAEPAPAEVPPHPLVLATEALYRGRLPQACDGLLKLAAMSPGLTDDDLIRLQFVTAMRGLDEGNELRARRTLSQVLLVDRSARPPPYTTQPLRSMLEEARSHLPSGAPSPDRESRLAAARKAASTREPAPRALLGAVDALYTDLQIDGAGAVLDLARASTPLSAADRAQVALRDGILKMEGGEEASAREAFRQALELDPAAHLPEYVPPKTLGVFHKVRLASGAAPKPPPIQAGMSSPARPVSQDLGMDDSQRWGLVTGAAGGAAVLAGAVAGVVALQAYHSEQSASTGGDYDTYLASRRASNTAIVVSNCLYGVGVAGVGVGAFLFFRGPGHQIAVGAGAGKRYASVQVGGSF